MRSLIISLVLCGSAFAQVVLAQSPTGVPGSDPTKLENPLGNVTLLEFFLKIIDVVIVFAIPVIVFFIILAGFKYVTAGGNAENIKSATKALTWAVIGGVLILGAKVLLVAIQNTVSSLRIGQ